MKIIFRESNEKLFLNKWEEYINNNLASYKYLPIYLEYMLFYTSSLVYDKSFVIIEQNKCVAICFLPIENNDNTNIISLANGYTIAPLAINKRIEKDVFAQIDLIAKENDIKKIKFYLDPLIIEYQNKFNYLSEYNYIDSSSSDCLLDLNDESDILWKNLRKSYKSLINKIEKDNDYEVIYFDKNNLNYGVHEKYRELHAKAAGRVTRAKETFDKQFELMKNGFATLIGLKYKGKFIGLNYFFHFQKTVVYASGADDPEFTAKKIPIYHVILWNATKHFKEKCYEYIQYSQPCGYNKINGFDDYLDEKQINISHFKRGMGTKMVPLFRGIKYLDEELFVSDINRYKISHTFNS